MNANGSGDVLDLLLAHVFECEVELIAHLILNNAAYANSAGFGQGFEPCRDIDPVAIDVAPVSDYVTDIGCGKEPRQSGNGWARLLRCGRESLGRGFRMLVMSRIRHATIVP